MISHLTLLMPLCLPWARGGMVVARAPSCGPPRCEGLFVPLHSPDTHSCPSTLSRQEQVYTVLLSPEPPHESRAGIFSPGPTFPPWPFSLHQWRLGCTWGGNETGDIQNGCLGSLLSGNEMGAASQGVMRSPLAPDSGKGRSVAFLPCWQISLSWEWIFTGCWGGLPRLWGVGDAWLASRVTSCSELMAWARALDSWEAYHFCCYPESLRFLET